MATRNEIKKAILAAVGNPSSGVIADNADVIADAVVALDAPAKVEEPKVEQPKPETKRAVDSRETRTVQAKETR